MRTMDFVLAITLPLSGFGCTAETSEGSIESDAATQDLREEAVRILKARGIDVSNLVFDGQENVIVEGDMVMSLHAILEAGATDRPKGYWYELFGSPAPASNVALNLASNLPSAWKTAFRAAAVEWSKIADIDIAEGSGSSFLVVSYIPFKNFLGVPDTTTFARGAVPPWSLGVNGSIEVNSNYSGTCFTGSSAPSQRQKTAMHEMGHTLGFMHPNTGLLIPGTSSGTGYPTVMAQGCFAMAALSADDVASANIKY